MMKPSRLAAWLKQVPREVDRFVIVLLPTDEDPAKEKPIATYPSYAEAETAHEDFAIQLLSEIQSHCDTGSTVNRYDIRAMAHNEILSSRVIRGIPSPADQLPDPLDITHNSMAANSGSQQLVRISEALLRVNVQAFGMIQNAWQDLLRVQADQIERLQRREAQLADNVLLEIGKQGEIEESEIRKANAFSKLTELLEQYAPAVISNLSGEDTGDPS